MANSIDTDTLFGAERTTVPGRLRVLDRDTFTAITGRTWTSAQWDQLDDKVAAGYSLLRSEQLPRGMKINSSRRRVRFRSALWCSLVAGIGGGSFYLSILALLASHEGGVYGLLMSFACMLFGLLCTLLTLADALFYPAVLECSVFSDELPDDPTATLLRRTQDAAAIIEGPQLEDSEKSFDGPRIDYAIADELTTQTRRYRAPRRDDGTCWVDERDTRGELALVNAASTQRVEALEELAQRCQEDADARMRAFDGHYRLRIRDLVAGTAADRYALDELRQLNPS